MAVTFFQTSPLYPKIPHPLTFVSVISTEDLLPTASPPSHAFPALHPSCHHPLFGHHAPRRPATLASSTPGSLYEFLQLALYTPPHSSLPPLHPPLHLRLRLHHSTSLNPSPPSTSPTAPTTLSKTPTPTLTWESLTPRSGPQLKRTQQPNIKTMFSPTTTPPTSRQSLRNSWLHTSASISQSSAKFLETAGIWEMMELWNVDIEEVPREHQPQYRGRRCGIFTESSFPTRRETEEGRIRERERRGESRW